MNWFDLLVSASLFATLLGIIYTKFIYPPIAAAYQKDYLFAEQMRAKYCLYKFLYENQFNFSQVYNYFQTNGYSYTCTNQTYEIAYQIVGVPTGKSGSCINCIYFVKNSELNEVCVNNTTVALQGDFLRADYGDIVDNIWVVNATNLTACALTPDNYILIREAPSGITVWGYNISGGKVISPIYSETLWLWDGKKWLKVKFTLG